MKTNTYVMNSSGRIALSTAVAEAFISRASVGTTAPDTRRAQVDVTGQYVRGPGGRAEVVVRVDPQAFNRAMAVRKINEQIDGQHSVDLSTTYTSMRRK